MISCGNKRPGLSDISVRPALLNERDELGHFEGGQIVWGISRSSILWLAERASRFSIKVTC